MSIGLLAFLAFIPILIAMILSGFKGMLVAAAVLGWLYLIADSERAAEGEKKEKAE